MSTSPLAIVTGANGNLGHVMCERLEADAIRVARVERHMMHIADAFDCELDFAQPQTVTRAFEQAARHAGKLAAVVHTIGAYRGGRSLSETPDGDFLELFETNVMATVHVLRAALSIMVPARCGSIAVVVSRDALRGGAKHAAYAATKAAQLRAVESAAAEASAHGIRVNAVLPGTMDTPQNQAAMPNADRRGWLQLSAVADVLAYLVSERAAAINGQAIEL